MHVAQIVRKLEDSLDGEAGFMHVLYNDDIRLLPKDMAPIDFAPESFENTSWKAHGMSLASAERVTIDPNDAVMRSNILHNPGEVAKKLREEILHSRLGASALTPVA
jgi:hypothetical protein